MARKKEDEGVKDFKGKILVIMIPDEGEPQFKFSGQWSSSLIERMMRKANRALRQYKVRMSQEAQRKREAAEAVTLTDDKQEGEE